MNPPRGTPSAPAQSSLGHSTYWVPAHQGPDGDTRGTFWRKAILGLYCWPWCRIVILDPGKIHDHTRLGAERENPQVHKPAWAWTWRRRELSAQGPGCSPPLDSALAPADMQSSWNSRQPISEQRHALISMHCAGSHLPPGGGVPLHLDQASGRKGQLGMLKLEHLSQGV